MYERDAKSALSSSNVCLSFFNRIETNENSHIHQKQALQTGKPRLYTLTKKVTAVRRVSRVHLFGQP